MYIFIFPGFDQGKIERDLIRKAGTLSPCALSQPANLSFHSFPLFCTFFLVSFAFTLLSPHTKNAYVSACAMQGTIVQSICCAHYCKYSDFVSSCYHLYFTFCHQLQYITIGIIFNSNLGNCYLQGTPHCAKHYIRLFWITHSSTWWD